MAFHNLGVALKIPPPFYPKEYCPPMWQSFLQISLSSVMFYYIGNGFAITILYYFYVLFHLCKVPSDLMKLDCIILTTIE